MMAELVYYKGIQVVDGATGDGGLALANSLKALVDQAEATETVVADNTAARHGRTHNITSASDHSPAAAVDYGKLVQANATNGAIEFSSLKAADVATRAWVQSRGMNLVTNGSGSMLNNHNFSKFVFDPVDTHGGGGSFSLTGLQIQSSDELMPVDPMAQYRLRLWAKAGNLDGSGYTATTNRQFFGIVEYDIDGLQILPQHVFKVTGSTDTTLAVPLNPGDTTITLTNATGWHNGAQGHYRNIAWYPYTNSKGYTYADYTYTRNETLTSHQTTGIWDSGASNGTLITLRSPWTGPALAAGTKVRNPGTATTFRYIAADNVAVPNTWTRYDGFIGGYQALNRSWDEPNKFRAGTAYVKLLVIGNYHNVATDIIRISDIRFGEMASD